MKWTSAAVYGYRELPATVFAGSDVTRALGVELAGLVVVDAAGNGWPATVLARPAQPAVPMASERDAKTIGASDFRNSNSNSRQQSIPLVGFAEWKVGPKTKAIERSAELSYLGPHDFG